MMQYFHWCSPADGTLWKLFADNAPDLSKAGITAAWLPPAYKGIGGGNDAGYGVYDLFDLGEFDQKGFVRTKYGTRDEYLNAIKAAQKENREDGLKNMQTPLPNITYIDITEHINNPVITKNEDWGEFRCTVDSVSVWVTD